uniref:Uncharacterized protein n=1 Tax=Electrophorus electricus TaxID=8005 RepID=A0A4W4FNM3_ELEEL
MTSSNFLLKIDRHDDEKVLLKVVEESSHFFTYLVCTVLLVAILYIAYHNKRKIIASIFGSRTSRTSRRQYLADYQRLDQRVSTKVYTHDRQTVFTLWQAWAVGH